MLTVLPKRLQQALNGNSAGNLDLFAFEPGYVREVIAGGIKTAKELHAAG